MQDIRFLRGVGEARAKLFAKKNIRTIEDLLYFFPRDYEDRTLIKTVENTTDGETVCIHAAVFSPVKEKRIRKNLTIYTVLLHDDTGRIWAVWYNNKFAVGKFITGAKYIFYGKIAINNGKREIINPVYEKEGENRFTGKIVPIYPLAGSLTQKTVQAAVSQAIEQVGTLEDILPNDMRERYNIAEINFCIKNIHFPSSFESLDIAKNRFVFEEFLILQLAMLLRKKCVESEMGNAFYDSNCVGEFIKKLPFSLTSAQKRTLDEIVEDMKKSRPMNRLVQGDVGSGKTVVAAAAMYMAAKNGYQAAIMAPTEILARQHFETFCEFFKDDCIRIVLLTGSMTAKEKRAANEAIEKGNADIIIGTHAIIQSSVKYNKLGLVIADEQHRFGVSQRAALAGKGKSPHILIMTATPIPRTLSLIIYGDLDISVIDELPPGRKSVKTYAVEEDMRRRVWDFLERSVRQGMQAYVVCPLVEESENMDLYNAQELAKKMQAAFSHLKIGLIHGKMTNSQKNSVMNEFINGNIHILVSTTVIEVGVNVPNANIMIVENAERFGLSQLHQLRGRVGRGRDQAFCILFVHGNNDVTKKRMKIICESNDGFYISEQDLKLRGPGDFFGVRQHGLPKSLFEDVKILKTVSCAANEIVAGDKIWSKEYETLKKKAESVFKEDIAMN
ncbi:MAG: ATP-dependent DNA helicase RecG [Clostridia bacterium]|nr:ATP-dependent DNA helicase RecG [Clostridia bacterium]